MRLCKTSYGYVCTAGRHKVSEDTRHIGTSRTPILGGKDLRGGREASDDGTALDLTSTKSKPQQKAAREEKDPMDQVQLAS